ncbi:hypothetical protein A2U01_0077550, partial [Trifolium medium]|nr:hypothetical protein [Trifolium medium]
MRLLVPACRAGVYGALRHSFRSVKKSLWYLRAAQCYVARCAGLRTTTGTASGCCASRRMGWR